MTMLGADSATQAALMARVRNVVSGADGSGPRTRQALLKVMGGRKSADGVRGLFRYVSRTRPEDEHEPKPLLFDRHGQELTAAMGLDLLENEWGLLDDIDNLSGCARRMAEDGRAASLGSLAADERLRLAQAHHLTWSFRVDELEDEDEQADRMRRAATDSIASAFGFGRGGGHRVIWAIHRDEPGRPHVHMIIRAARDDGDGQIRLDRAELGALRHIFTRDARAHGLDVVASRREDRPAVRARILAGEERLRTGLRMVHIKRGTDLADRVPAWYARHGAAWEKRAAEEAAARRHAREDGSRRLADGLVRLGADKDEVETALDAGLVWRLAREVRARARALNDKGLETDVARALAVARGKAAPPRGRSRNDVADAARRSSPAGGVAFFFEGMHARPAEAIASFYAMAAEDISLAAWHAVNRPSVFSVLTLEGAASREGLSPAARKVLKKDILAAANTDRDRIAAARAAQPPRYPAREAAASGSVPKSVPESVPLAIRAARAEQDRWAVVRSLRNLAAAAARHLGVDIGEGQPAAILGVAARVAAAPVLQTGTRTGPRPPRGAQR